METYHKIQTLFKRYTDGPNKGRMIEGAWTTPELEYLAGNKWEFTEKVDGTNIRINLWRINGRLYADIGGRTDNATIPTPLLRVLHQQFPEYRAWVLDENDTPHGRWMVENNLDNVTLFGEGYGAKIQGGGKYVKDAVDHNMKNKGNPDVDSMVEHSFVLFDVKIGDFWLTRDNVDDIAAKLGIESVPVIGHGSLYDAISIVKYGFAVQEENKILNVNQNLARSHLVSNWGDFEAEGIVARPTVPMFDRKGERIITKIKAVDFR